MYKDNKDNDHNSTVVGLTDRADMRYEFTILTHEAGAYSVRCESSKDYKDWTSTIASIVPPPLSGAPEIDEEDEHLPQEVDQGGVSRWTGVVMDTTRVEGLG